MTAVEEVLQFWFGPLDDKGQASPSQVMRWWKKDVSLDEEIRGRFGLLREAVLNGEHDGWLATPRGRLAYVIVLDQLSRNLYRGDSRAFSADERALMAALDGIELGVDRQLAFDERGFLYMPLMHAEDLSLQERCVALLTAWCDEVSGELRTKLVRSLDFARQHRDIIARFGRFPHRNPILMRTSTAAEVEFLLQPGSSF